MSGRRAVVLIGDPVEGSVSPPMQQAAFDALGLDLRYEALRVPSHRLAGGLDRLREHTVGLNVTRPLKEAVIPLMDSVSEEAARAGSVNTVIFREAPDGGTVTAEGHSTDGAGFLAALERRTRTRDRPGSAVILGTGGAARAVAAAMAGRGASVAVSGRSAQRGLRLAEDLGVAFVPPADVLDALAHADLVVNATPLGSGSNVETPLPPGAVLHRGMVVFDLVYRPRETPLLRQARAAGCRTVEGIEMLIEQGARSFELWTGLSAPLAVMRTAAYQALAAPSLARVG